eukprot:TRINITY_DN15573_c0_g1::TRINITY_DN15573_c0_g1_i1::g.28585::m.28585 TRINITY_DN15573_c0_g1::TRINITY_DN15573_c0_g1_i1::g.28585  ORF type:complete len:174 (-),score=5.19,DUF3592/PF12158.3/4e-08 TRINITY_DN15573_c0_g1_i1:529-1050(-)
MASLARFARTRLSQGSAFRSTHTSTHTLPSPPAPSSRYFLDVAKTRFRNAPVKYLSFSVFTGVFLYQLPYLYNGVRSVGFKPALGKITTAAFKDGKPILKYKYSVDGIEYTGRRISYGDDIDAYHGAFLHDDDVAVWYNPSQPSEAVIVPGVRNIQKTVALTYLMAGGIMLLL